MNLERQMTNEAITRGVTNDRGASYNSPSLQRRDFPGCQTTDIREAITCFEQICKIHNIIDDRTQLMNALTAFDTTLTTSYLISAREDDLSYHGFIEFIKTRDFSPYHCHMPKTLTAKTTFSKIIQDAYKTVNSPTSELLKSEIIERLPSELKPQLRTSLHLPVDTFTQVAGSMFNTFRTNPPSNFAHTLHSHTSKQKNKQTLNDKDAPNVHSPARLNETIKQQNLLCYYHNRFGPSAFKCEGYPCPFFRENFNQPREQFRGHYNHPQEQVQANQAVQNQMIKAPNQQHCAHIVFPQSEEAVTENPLINDQINPSSNSGTTEDIEQAGNGLVMTLPHTEPAQSEMMTSKTDNIQALDKDIAIPLINKPEAADKINPIIIISSASENDAALEKVSVSCSKEKLPHISSTDGSNNVENEVANYDVIEASFHDSSDDEAIEGDIYANMESDEDVNSEDDSSDDVETDTDINVMKNTSLPHTILFTIDKTTKLPVLIDTGSSISIIPNALCSHYDMDTPVTINGFTGDSLVSLGSVDMILDLGLGELPPHRFTVANLTLPYILAGLDFLMPRKIYPVLHRKILTREGSNKCAPLLEASEIQGNYPSSTLKTPSVFFTAHGTSNLNYDSAEERTRKILEEFPELTMEPDYRVPAKHTHRLDIQLNKNFKPFSHRARPTTLLKKDAAEKSFVDLLRRGAVQRGYSHTVSPITIVPKKDNRVRVCVDYTTLNRYTVPLNFPLPLVQSLPDRVSDKHSIFTVLNLKEAYHSLPLTERAQKLAAIISPCGTYLPLRCPFGLRNAPKAFSALVREVISGCEAFCFVYLDDFLVYSQDLEQHLSHVRQLLQRLQKFGLKVNPKKCHFGQKEVTFLGHMISQQGIRPMTDKIQALTELKQPTTLKELRGLLGALNYYRSFIPNMSKTLSPLSELLKGPRQRKNSASIVWEPIHETAMSEAIGKLKEATHLAYDDMTLPIILTTDASLHHVGAVLEQPNSEFDPDLSNYLRDTRPLVFFSKPLPKRSTPTSAFRREL